MSNRALARVVRISRESGAPLVEVEITPLATVDTKGVLEWACEGFGTLKQISLEEPPSHRERIDVEARRQVLATLQAAGVTLGFPEDAHPANVLAALCEKAGVK